MTEQNLQVNHFATSLSPAGTQPTQRMAQHFFLLWINTNIDESTADFHHSLNQLRNVINDVASFKQPDDAIDFLTDIHGMSGFLIVIDTMGEQILPLIHDILVLDTIYILTTHLYQQHEKWAEKWSKIKGVHADIPSICLALQLATKQCDQNSIAVSFVTMSPDVSDVNLNRLEPSFMYTQLFKEILFEMKDDENSVKVLIGHCRKLYTRNTSDSRIIDEFERDYRPESAIWWYTRECFVYRMLNHALREIEGDTIINMGFFIRDLHRQIQQLHSQQVKIYNGEQFIVYRGQGLSKDDFEKLVKTKGGLMSFNNFLSTSTEQTVPLSFAKRARSRNDTIGILFQMIVAPSVLSMPFASIREYSYYKKEEEILFSMHAVFRVNEIIKTGTTDSLYQVNLQLTPDDDQELRTLTKRIRNEIVGTTGWDRLGYLLIELNQLHKAEELYNMLRQGCPNPDPETFRYHELGRIRRKQGNYKEALSFYEKDLEIKQKTLPANHPSLGICYNNIGGVYYFIGCYAKSISYYERARNIWQISLPANHPHIKQLQQNIDIVKKNL